MESSEDDAGTATTASRRASAREKDIGQAEDDNATGNAVYESTEARASCGTPAMSEDNFDGDSVPSPSTQDVNTSTEAILDMIDEFVDGPGAPKRLPLSGADDSEHSECVKVSDETSTGEVPKDVPGNPPPTIASPAASAKCDSEPCASKGDALTESLPHNSVPPEIVNTECVKSHQECSVSICNKTRAKCLEPPVEAELVSEYPPKLVSSVEPKPASVCILKPSKELEQASDSPLEDSRKSDQTSECPPESSIESNAVHDSLPGPSKDPQKSKKPSKPTSECHQEPSGSTVPSESKQKPMAKSELAREIPQDASGESGAPRICEQASEDACGPPPVNIPSSSIVESVQSASDVSECERHERTVKCVTSSDSRNDVTIESAESTSSDISLSEEKVSGGEQLTRSPLRRRLVRPAPADRRPDSTVSSTVDIHSTQQLSCESLAKDVSSSSDAVPSIHGNVKPEEIRNVSEISVCKAETSVSPKKIRLIRQKVSAPIRDNVPDNQNNQLESEQCQSTSSDGSILADFVDNTAKSDIVSNSLTHEPQIGLIDASNIKIQLPITKDEFMPSTVTTLKSEESTSSAIKSSLTNEESMEHGDERNLKLKIDVSTPELSETTQAVSKNKDLNEHLQSEPESPKQVPKLTIKLGNKQSEEMKSPVPKLTIKPIKPPSEDVETDSNVPIPNVTKINIKPIVKPPENVTEGVSNMSENAGELNADSSEQRDRLRIPNVTKLNIKPIMKPSEKITDNPVKSTEHLSDSKSESNILMESMPIPNVTKLNIKPVVKPSERTIDSPSKLSEHLTNADSSEQMESMPIPNVTKINIKPIIKPSGNNEIPMKSAEHSEAKADSSDQKPSITKLNIKPIPRPPEKINDTHRKSSSSEISESEYSENDESTSTSDQASASDQGPSDTIPKVTIKLGKPGTTSEGKFYAEKNIPKLTIKGLQHNENEESESVSKLTLVISQPEEKHSEKVPKLTIKTVAKSEGQPLSPKLTIKPLKPPDAANKDINSDHYEKQQSPKCFTSSMDVKENAHVPKITIKPITKLDSDLKPSKKSSVSSDGPEQIPLVTKLNIKPILKPADDGETSEGMEDKVPVVSKLNIKPIVKPKDNEVVSSIDDVPKITKLNIKPLKNPEEESSEEKDCDELNTDKEENSIPVVSKLNIKPIIKPVEEDNLKYSENQSSETGNSSDENTDHIPVVTKINIKPIMKPNELVESSKHKVANEETIPPTVAKLNIKPLVKPEESASPSSPKKDSMKNVDIRNTNIPVVTKLNIKPVIKPEELDQSKVDVEDKGMKKPPLVMKINMKVVADTSLNESLNNTYDSEHIHNNVGEEVPVLKRNIKPVFKPADSPKGADKLETDKTSTSKSDIVAKQDKDGNLSQKEILKQNCVDNHPTRQPAHLENESGAVSICQIEMDRSSLEGKTARGDPNSQPCQTDGNKMSSSKVSSNEEPSPAVNAVMTINKQMTSVKNCTLLKKLLESNESINEKSNVSQTKVCNSFSLRTVAKDSLNCEQFDSGHSSMEKVNDVGQNDSTKTRSPSPVNDVNTPQVSLKIRPIHELCTEANESVTKPLEINISEKISNQSSGQDSPRIILKINKTDHGPSAKIITEEVNKTDILQHISEKVSEMSNDKPSPTKKNIVNSRRKLATESPVTLGKRLRSSRIVESADKSKSPILKRMIGKRPPAADASPQNKDSELTVLESKRLKLGQLLSNKSLTITPVITKKSPESKPVEIKQGSKTVNHTLVNNENCSKNGNSKLHNILTNLQVKQIQSLPFNDINCSDKNPITAEAESNTSTGSSDVVEILRVENCHPDMQEMMINENSDYRDFSIGGDEISQDPLEIETPKTDADSLNESASVPTLVQSTPQPKKRGRPRKLPVSEDAKAPAPSSVTLPVPALEERPQRSLRLSRDRPAILAKPRGGRGRGRGRGRGKLNATPSDRPEAAPSAPETPEVSESDRSASETPGTPEPLDPTSSRVKLPRMTEALDRLPATCATPLSSRHSTERFEAPEMKVVLESTPMTKMEDSNGSTSASGSGARGGRGGARGRGRGARTPRTPRLGRGRGRGGGRGAMYMKETMGIYGRVCGPATTTVQLFEEETCMMDDNATPAKPTHLLDEDSQSSVKSSTNESSKMKKSKFADLFDSNKEWTAADVKEYIWPPADKPDEDSQVMMIQEQVAMFLGVKSFKRRYPELKRRSISGDERDYVLAKGLVTEVLCDLGITAVDASEVLDIMLSDFPHKYEEFRGHQRQKQLVAAAASASEPAEEPKPEEPAEKPERVELKPPEPKHEPPKVDPEKTRQDLAAAAIASAAEWNARLNVVRRPACADLQSLTLHTRRPPRPAPARPHLRPPAGFYPHALLPGQYQHTCRVYTPQQLRYFPLNTAMEAPPMPPSPDSSEESDVESDRTDCSADSDRLPAKRKKLTKVKRSNSHTEREDSRDAEVVDTCRVCKLRLEANRKHTHERFLVCGTCNAKIHPICSELGADTIRKCREYSWQCAACKVCAQCRRAGPALLCCDLCDRGFHPPCLRLDAPPPGRWHCVECAICKSCGARTPSGPAPPAPPQPPADATPPPPQPSQPQPGPPAEWHHQTKRGPGGHKVYSHSLCTPCARAYRIGRYCPLCDRSFIGPKGTMQLVICKLCDRQLHQECVRQSVSALNVLDYTCGECRRGGITSRAAAVRLAPRTIATLFMAKRRFNKYAHRQYMQSRRRAPDATDALDATDASDANDTIDAIDASDAIDAPDPLDVPAPDAD